MTTAETRPNVSYGNSGAALPNEILRTVVGSGVHGIAIEGTDDHDEMGIYIEPREYIYGIRPDNADPSAEPGMPHHISRTKPEGERSGPGDTDLVMYSLRKYLRLAVVGNPNALLPLFAPPESVIWTTPLGEELRDLRTAFLSRAAVERFLGYMNEQHQRMLGRGKQNRVPNRPELVAAHGYDTKYASHALRLAYQGYEIATRGNLTLPMPEVSRLTVLEVKRGEWPREAVSAQIDALTAEIRSRMDSGLVPLPDTPYLPVISNWSIRAHEQHWHGGRSGKAHR